MVCNDFLPVIVGAKLNHPNLGFFLAGDNSGMCDFLHCIIIIMKGNSI